METRRLTVLIRLKLKWTVVTRFVSKIPPVRFKRFHSTFWAKTRQLPILKVKTSYYHKFNQFKILLADKAEKPDQLQIELQELNSGLKYIQNEQDYMLQRGKIHRQSTKIFHWKLLIFTFRFSRPKIEF